jgi:glycosyl transferase family 25
MQNSKKAGALPVVLVISLRSANARRRLMQAQLEAPGMPQHRFIDAVDGRELSARQVAEVYDDRAAKRHLRESMTDAEIGCAASHFAAYRHIVENSEPCAVVLEDDALLGYQFPTVLGRIAAATDPARAQAVLLCHVVRYSAWGAQHVDKIHRIYRVYEAYGAHAYLITLAGAKALLATFPRVHTVADDWRYFMKKRTLEVRAVVPYLVGTSSFSNSSQLAEERLIREQRVRACEPLAKQWIKKYLWQKFVFQLAVKPALRLHRAEQTW